MKTITIQFDSLKFIPVSILAGELFAFNASKFPDKLHSSTDNNVFTCYAIGLDGNLADEESFFQKSELIAVCVTVKYS